MATNNRIKERQKNRSPKTTKLYKFQQYEALNSCGCCKEVMYFTDDESAQTAMMNAGLNSVATVVDDSGMTHTQIDTFYGLIKLTQKEVKRRRDEYNESIRKSKRYRGL